MPVADLRASVSGGKACPNNCGGNGVCNSLGHCHCNRGFRPPDCTQPGVGGSEDSGPAEDPNGELILFHLPHPRTGYCYYHYYYLSLSVESNLDRTVSVAARNDFIMALYIIFLGIVPTIALSSFGIWYVRNSGQNWKKSMISTYVSSPDRVTEKCKPHAFTSRGARRANSSHTIGKNFYERFVIFFSPRRGNSRSANKIFTVSESIGPKQKLQITKTDLISTTNPDVINCSNSIEYRRSTLLGNASENTGGKGCADPSPAQSVEPQQARRNSHRSELGSKIAERIQQMQKKPTRNIKGLTVKTEVKFEHLNESPSSSSVGTAPRTGDPLLPSDGKPYSNTPAPFYNKKPPPPPAPAQHLKPKI